jgi:uncharacterized protein (DUF362 family)
MLTDNKVTAFKGSSFEYCDAPPFHPSEPYPEYSFGQICSCDNPAYRSVREVFRLAGLDASNFGTAVWNPLKDLISPGETVLLKPNLVKEYHPRDPQGWRYVITHGSVIRATADYVCKALGGRGKLIIADAPQTDSSFSKMVEILGLDVLREFYIKAGFDFELIDLRQEEWTNSGGVITDRKKLPGDPHGKVALDLREFSEFNQHKGAGRYYGADYDVAEVNRHHTGGRHEYLLAGSAIKCDVLFSLPKLKTHKKAGITVSLKNLVGINADKNWLPHHTEGSPSNGGDEHPGGDRKHSFERVAVAKVRRIANSVPAIGSLIHRIAHRAGEQVFGDTESVIRNGNWWGNETVWRMCLDLNKLLLYGNPDGSLRTPEGSNRKRHYVLVDGILAGEGRGPMNPDVVKAGLIVFGTNAPSVDAACAYLMGFDPEKIPIVRQAFRCEPFRLADGEWKDIVVASNLAAWDHKHLADIADAETFHFQPHFGWIGHIERDPSGAQSKSESGNVVSATSGPVAERSL